MEILGRIVVGLLAFVIGVLMMKYNFQIVNNIGQIGFAERYLGGGGTFSLFKILAILLIIWGFLYMTGLHTVVFGFLLAPLAQFFVAPGA